MKSCKVCRKKQTRPGKCWDFGYCAKCIASSGKDFNDAYRADGYHTRLYKSDNKYLKGMKQGERNWGAGNFIAPRDRRTAPTMAQINKASGQRLVELLERKIGEIYG